MAVGEVCRGRNFYDFLSDGNNFSYERLAEDVLYEMYSLFEVPRTLIPGARYRENIYKEPDAIRHITRQAKYFQILYRDTFYRFFNLKDPAIHIGRDFNGLNQFVTDTIGDIMDHLPEGKVMHDPIDKFSLSFALVVELTLFLIKHNKPKLIDDMDRAWVAYFNRNLKKEFEAKGGLAKVIRKASQEIWFDEFISKFVPSYCVPYTGEDVSMMFRRESRKVNSDSATLTNWLKKSIEEDITVDPLQVSTADGRDGIASPESKLKETIDDKLLRPQKKTAPTETDEATAKALSALSLGTVGKKSKKLLKASVLKEPLSPPSASALCVKDGKESDVKTSYRLSRFHKPCKKAVLLDIKFPFLPRSDAAATDDATSQVFTHETINSSKKR